MRKKLSQDQDRNPWMDRLNLLRKTPPPPGPTTAAAYPIPPSRKNRKALTTWQDEAALKHLRHIANETGLSQQALIAEGINFVLAKY